VLDSAPLLDAVATLDTVSLVRGGIRGLLRALPAELAAQVRAGLRRNDDYATAGKPTCDWDDPAAREELVDVLFRDGYRALFALRGAQLGPDAAQAAELLATVIGQDIQETPDGRFVIAEGVAPDRVISLADPEARHGHQTAAHGFDGYKGHIASDPDSEIITAAEIGPANGGDAAMAEALLADLPASGPAGQSATEATAGLDLAPVPAAYGDSAYGTGAVLAHLDGRSITAMTKVPPLVAPRGRFAKDRFTIDLAAGTVTCPARLTVAITPRPGGGGLARFGRACQVCPLASACTHQPIRAHHHHPPPRGPARPRPPAAAGSRLAGGLPRDPAEGGTQAGAPAAPPPRRAARPHARAPASGPGLAPAGRCGQPRPPRHPRRRLQIRRLGGRACVARRPGQPVSTTDHDPDPTGQPPSPNHLRRAAYQHPLGTS